MVRSPTSRTWDQDEEVMVETARPASTPAFPICQASPTYPPPTCRCSSTRSWAGPVPVAAPVPMPAALPALAVGWAASTSISTPGRLPPRLPTRWRRSFWPETLAARVEVEVEVEPASSTAAPLRMRPPAESSRSITVRYWPTLNRPRFRRTRSRCSMRGANHRWVANTRVRPRWPAVSLPWEGWAVHRQCPWRRHRLHQHRGCSSSSRRESSLNFRSSNSFPAWVPAWDPLPVATCRPVQVFTSCSSRLSFRSRSFSRLPWRQRRQQERQHLLTKPTVPTPRPRPYRSNLS
mmetsp:Transcript_28479/g.82385  ORF Transcript_28479/g.82385 Transcript_28479/m.82385 type:complete len:292 (+) Transcript_28479:934-1809(+)